MATRPDGTHGGVPPTAGRDAAAGMRAGGTAGERTPGTAAVPVQGTLFPTEPTRTATRGYRGAVASRVAGITYRQLDYWARRQIVEPSIKPSHGSGTRRLYSFKDVVILAVSKKLLDVGVNLQNVTHAIGYLQRCDGDDLAHVTIMSDGERVHECTTDDEVLDMVRSGSAVFGVSVGTLWRAIRDALDHEESVDLTRHTDPDTDGPAGTTPAPSTPSSGMTGTTRPRHRVDELAQARARRRMRAGGAGTDGTSARDAVHARTAQA